MKTKTTLTTLASLAPSANAESGKRMKASKRFTNRLALVALVMGIVTLSTGGAGASTVIFSDSFTRAGALNGSAPEVRPGSETWTATNWTTNGSAAQHQVAGALANQAMLPFSPVAGNLYRLEALLNVNTTSNTAHFAGIGFAPSLTATNQASFYPNLANPYIYESFNAWRAWMPLGLHTSSVATGTATAGVAESYAIELDTRDPLWTASFFVNGTMVNSTTYASNPTINAVGIMTWAPSFNGSAAFVDNFELTIVPEPSSALLVGLGLLTLLRRRR